ncbi:MAG: zinc-ribbon and DUF3426 domain-containing protein [Amphritea sp.]|nr:zinc-ribbon and DUF3426 domain-containing protein [Amphritea sp.]
MISHNIITECPACTTRFQVTPGQLKIAHGKVRCGECLEVFNAELYRCDDVTDPLTNLVPDLLDDADQPYVDAFNNTPSSEELSSDELFDIDPLANDQVNDEALINDLLSDPFNNDPLFDQIDVPNFTSESNAAIDKRYPAADIKPIHPQLPPSHDDLIWGAETDIPESISQNASIEDLEQPVSNILQTTQPDDAPDISNTARQTNSATFVSKPVETEADLRASKASSVHLTDFRAEPIVISRQEKIASQHGWTALSLIAVLLLIGQYLWFNRQLLSHYPELSPAYQYACQYLPCDLDTPIMLEQIITRQLVVRQHPDYQGVLMVHLLLENQAERAQPYPAILLSFSDRLGQTISQRVFQPRDYLNSTQMIDMPAKRPVQIEFELLDPGRRATSYEASLQKPLKQNRPFK